MVTASPGTPVILVVTVDVELVDDGEREAKKRISARNVALAVADPTKAEPSYLSSFTEILSVCLRDDTLDPSGCSWIVRPVVDTSR